MYLGGMDEPKHPSLAQRLMQAGVAKSHAYQIAEKHDAGTLSLLVAIRTWRRTGMKLGPLADVSDAKVRDLAKMVREAA